MAVATTTMALLLTAPAAWAQVTEWAVGSWQGFLRNYPGKEGGDRFMTVSTSGKCTWNSALASEPVVAQSCAIAGDTLTLLTVAKAQVSLKFKGGRLEGTFQTSTGQSFLITMTRQ